MKFGIRECCDVVFRAKAPMKVGNKIFYRNEPVIYFDSLKTSTLEGAATTVYAQGGRGNARLMSWDGERTVTFTMEDALISPEGLAILTGAGVIEASKGSHKSYVHATETIALEATGTTGAVSEKKLTITGVKLQAKASTDPKAGIYVMLLDGNDNVLTEPMTNRMTENGAGYVSTTDGLTLTITAADVTLPEMTEEEMAGYKVLVDYYTEHEDGVTEISITPDKFGGAFYIEGSTLFREYPSQRDLPAEIIIPNGRVQSNFSFTMASSGDPSTFTFTIDAFPDYTRFNVTEKVLATIQVVGAASSDKELTRDNTASKQTI